MVGGVLLANPEPLRLSEATIRDLAAIGIQFDGALVPSQLFGLDALTDLRLLAFLLFGGALVGFGAGFDAKTFAGTKMLGIPEINETLESIVEEREIEMRFRHNLVAVDGNAKIATFDVTNADTGEVTQEEVPFDMLHVTPPMSAPDVVASSPLAVAEGPHHGYVDVDDHTLQHVRYPDVFALGDVAALPTAKTGAAVRKQAPVLVANLLAHRAGREDRRAYDGYSSCPLVTGYGRLVLAEFTYGNAYKPTFPIDQTKERLDMYLLKRYVLPLLYWRFMLRGLA